MIIEVLETKNLSTTTGPTRADLDTWITTYKLPVTSLIDPPSAPLATFNTYGQREQAFVVDLKTMKILKKVEGSLAGVGDSSVKQLIPFLLDLLSKA